MSANDQDVDDLQQIKSDVANLHKEHLQETSLYKDKILNELNRANVYLTDF